MEGMEGHLLHRSSDPHLLSLRVHSYATYATISHPPVCVSPNTRVGLQPDYLYLTLGSQTTPPSHFPLSLTEANLINTICTGT